MDRLVEIAKIRERQLEMQYRLLEVMDAEKGSIRTASYKRLEKIKVDVLMILGEYERFLN